VERSEKSFKKGEFGNYVYVGNSRPLSDFSDYQKEFHNSLSPMDKTELVLSMGEQDIIQIEKEMKAF
jgi:hypothetical protein